MKQTPRDLLISRHAEAAARLDAVRREAIAEGTPVPARELLPALFHPHRRIWLGLGTVWAVILVVSLFQPAPPPADPATLAQAARLQARSEAQLYALLATTAPSR